MFSKNFKSIGPSLNFFSSNFGLGLPFNKSKNLLPSPALNPARPPCANLSESSNPSSASP